MPARLRSINERSAPWSRPVPPPWVDLAVSSSMCTRSMRTAHVLTVVTLHHDVEVPVVAQRHVVLGDLVVLGQVRVEVVLAVELAALGDAAVEREPEPGRGLDPCG
jgi:hypothetical protein